MCLSCESDNKTKVTERASKGRTTFEFEVFQLGREIVSVKQCHLGTRVFPNLSDQTAHTYVRARQRWPPVKLT